MNSPRFMLTSLSVSGSAKSSFLPRSEFSLWRFIGSSLARSPNTTFFHRMNSHIKPKKQKSPAASLLDPTTKSSKAMAKHTIAATCDFLIGTANETPD
jgi:hypothetical protein